MVQTSKSQSNPFLLRIVSAAITIVVAVLGIAILFAPLITSQAVSNSSDALVSGTSLNGNMFNLDNDNAADVRNVKDQLNSQVKQAQSAKEEFDGISPEMKSIAKERGYDVDAIISTVDKLIDTADKTSKSIDVVAGDFDAFNSIKTFGIISAVVGFVTLLLAVGSVITKRMSVLGVLAGVASIADGVVLFIAHGKLAAAIAQLNADYGTMRSTALDLAKIYKDLAKATQQSGVDATQLEKFPKTLIDPSAAMNFMTVLGVLAVLAGIFIAVAYIIKVNAPETPAFEGPAQAHGYAAPAAPVTQPAAPATPVTPVTPVTPATLETSETPVTQPTDSTTPDQQPLA
ncbi:hypothetical protein [Alloscardovia venturai]